MPHRTDSDPLMTSKFHNEIHDPKGQIKIYTIMKSRETILTAATQSHSPAVVKSNMFLKRLSYGSKVSTFSGPDWLVSINLGLISGLANAFKVESMIPKDKNKSTLY